MELKKLDRGKWSWAFYDWANSAFATTVMAGFFPIFLKQYWSSGSDPNESTFQLGLANAIAGLVIAIIAPALGAIADRGGAKKKFLLFFTIMGIVMTGALYFVQQGNWLVAIIVFVVATVGFTGGNVFYDSLIIDVATDEESDFVSAFGYSLGYLGGGLVFAVNVGMTLKPELFGLADMAEAVRWSFISVSVWWTVFCVPVFLFVREPGEQQDHGGFINVIQAGFRQFRNTFSEIRALRTVFLFLLAYWFYIDGVNTVIKMAVDYGLSLGFPTSSLITALLLVQFIGFPAAIAFGYLGEKFGTKFGLYVGIMVYTGVTFWAYYMDTVSEFYAMAVAIGLVQGGVQSLSRSFYSRIIPSDKSAEFFGFYGMFGKFAAILGPFMMGWIAVSSGSPRLAIVSIAILFVIGAAVLFFVNESEGRAQARLMEGSR
ncbi:MAG: MFS transporter [Gammaproteobacteria bacterium]